MLRALIGFAIFAVVAIVALNLLFGLFGVVIGLAFVLLKLALVGFVFYLILRLVSPRTADRVREMISGRSA
jgi:hypothetical protein